MTPPWRNRSHPRDTIVRSVNAYGVLRRTSCVLAACLNIVDPAAAGPPLLSDDPNTVGPGQVEAVLATSAVGFANAVDVLAPTVDLTLGVFEGVDLALVASPLFSVVSDSAVETAASIEVAVKWQPLRGEHWNAAFTPAVALNPLVLGETAFTLPVQIERAWTKFTIGVDGGYVVGVNGSDVWFGALYGSLTANRSLALLAEVWGGRALLGQQSAAGFTLGLDWTTPLGLQLLVAGGPGVSLSSTRRVRWYAYLGLQRRFTLWQTE